MKNYYGLEKGDRLVRNAYTVSHFTVGKEYEILTFVDGQPRVMGDKGEMVTITSQYNPKYFDLLSLPDTGQLKAGDLIKFQKNYNNLGREKEYIVNRSDDKATPYVYGLNGKMVRLTNRTYFFKKVGSLKQSLAHQAKPDSFVDFVVKKRDDAAASFMKLGISEETAKKAADEMIMKGLSLYAELS